MTPTDWPDPLHHIGVVPTHKRRLEYAARDGWQAASLLEVSPAAIADLTLFWLSHRPFGVLHSPERPPRIRRLQQWFGQLVRPMNVQETVTLCQTPHPRLPWRSGDYPYPLLMDRHLLDVPMLWISLGDHIFWVGLPPERLLQTTATYLMDISDGLWLTDTIPAEDRAKPIPIDVKANGLSKSPKSDSSP